MGEDEDGAARRIPRSMLTRVIQARVEEILAHVQQRLRASGYDVAVGRRAVLTGGGSQLAGVRDLAERVLNKQVRLGRPQMFPGMPASAGPDYATAVGLLMIGATMAPETLNPEVSGEPERAGGWLARLTVGCWDDSKRTNESVGLFGGVRRDVLKARPRKKSDGVKHRRTRHQHKELRPSHHRTRRRRRRRQRGSTT